MEYLFYDDYVVQPMTNKELTNKNELVILINISKLHVQIKETTYLSKAPPT